jgi:hypothetical protein
MLDNGTPHPVEWEYLTREYDKTVIETEDDINKSIDLVTEFDETSGYFIDSMEASHHNNNLSIDQIRSLSSHMDALYATACQRQKASGFPSDFANCIAGKKWLVYMYCKFKASVNTRLHKCAFAKLSQSVMHKSTNGGRSRRSSHGSSQSLLAAGGK